MKIITTKNNDGHRLSSEQHIESCIFKGIIYDNDLYQNAKGYVFDYLLVYNDMTVEGSKCTINDVNVSIRSRFGMDEKPVDVKTEITELKKEIKKYELLLEKNGNFIANDGLSYEDLISAYKENLFELENVYTPLLEEIKLQIKDRMNSNTTTIKEILIQDVSVLPYKKLYSNCNKMIS